jgi:4-amino-4-deoxy-L-arabinose transferase-like glycosyltransferase
MSQSHPDSPPTPSVASASFFIRATHALDRPGLATLLLFAWVMLGAWIRPLSLPDEGRYVGVAWEMVRSGDWLTPTLNGLPYFHKPPLFYWLTAVSIKAFGTVDLAMRLASMLAAALIAFAGARVLIRWHSAQMARWYLLVLATLPYSYLGSQFANHDMLVAAFISSAVLFAADALLSSDQAQPWHRSMLLAWACVALGLLSKGLIGIVLPAGVMLLWILVQRRWSWLIKLLWWPGIVLFALIAVPWFVLMQLKFPEFFDYFFIHQHFERFTETGFNNMNPWWFYPGVIAVLCLPWSVLLLGQVKLRTQSTTHAALRHLQWVWVVVIVGFFSIPASKLIGYVLPAIPAIAMLIADVVVTRLLPLRRAHLLPKAIVVICLLSFIPLVWIFGRADIYSAKPLAAAYRSAASPQDQVLSLGLYRFDFPIYAQLRSPLPVVLNWDDPSIGRTDSWPRELLDASKFDLPAGERVLIKPADLDALLCAKEVSWIIAPLGSNEPLLASAEIIRSTTLHKLVRFDRERSNLPCRGELSLRTLPSTAS